MHQIKRMFHNAVFSGCVLATIYAGPGWAQPPGSAPPYPQYEQAGPQYYDDRYGHPGMPAFPRYPGPQDNYPQQGYEDYPPAGAYPDYPPEHGMPGYGRPAYGGGRYPQPMDVPLPPPGYDSTDPAQSATDPRGPAYPAPIHPAAVPAAPQTPSGTSDGATGQVYELYRNDKAVAVTPPAPAETSTPAPAAVVVPPVAPVLPETTAATPAEPAPASEPESLYEKTRSKVDEVIGKDTAETPGAIPAAETPAAVDPTPVAPATPEPMAPVEPAAVIPAEPAPAAEPESLYEKARSKVDEVLGKDTAETPGAIPAAETPAAVDPTPVAPATPEPMAPVEPAAVIPAVVEPAPEAPSGSETTEPTAADKSTTLYDKVKTRIEELHDTEAQVSGMATAGKEPADPAWPQGNAPGRPETVLTAPAGPNPSSSSTDGGTPASSGTSTAGEPVLFPAAPAGPYTSAPAGDDAP